MARLPVISGRQAVKAFQKAGWVPIRRAGSHVMMVKSGTRITLSIPDHKELDRGTLRSLIRNAGMTVDQFTALLK
ncbi:MAG: type II toxin-antitoxin system HicA family toxin [Bacillota bacterium]